MALNFLGLGFSFGARDDGLGRAVQGLNNDFKKLGREILGLQRLQTLLSALSFVRLDQLGDKFKAISVSGLDLTSNIESKFQDVQVSAAKLGVSLGKNQTQINQMSKAAFALSKSLGISGEAALDAEVGFGYFGDTLKALGIKGAADFAKFGDVTGVNTQKFGYDLSQLQKSLGLTANDMARIINSAKIYGQETGNLSEELNGISQLQSLLMSQKLTFGKNSDQLAEFSSQIYSLGQAFQKAGIQDGKAFAMSIAENATKAGKDFKSLFSGVGDDIPEFAKQLALVGFPVDKAFKSMQEGPLDFIQGIANMVAPLFGGIAATGAIAITATNIRNGANSPLCVLAAILFVVAWNMSEPHRFIAVLKTAPTADRAIMVVTFLLTIEA